MILQVSRSAALFVLITLISSFGFTKDLTHRFGIGVKNNTSEQLPSIATVYHYSSDFAFTGGVGVDTQKDYSKFQLHGGVRKVIFAEMNLNFYAGAQLGMVNYEEPVAGKQSGFELLGVFGTEFFFTGLENVGFSFEGGLGVASLKNVRFRTVGDDPFRAGILFYF